MIFEMAKASSSSSPGADARTSFSHVLGPSTSIRTGIRFISQW